MKFFIPISINQFFDPSPEFLVKDFNLYPAVITKTDIIKLRLKNDLFLL